jgi:hypothetical protein
VEDQDETSSRGGLATLSSALGQHLTILNSNSSHDEPVHLFIRSQSETNSGLANRWE